MLKRINGYTKAQLAAGAADESLDFPAGVVGVPTDSASELFFFLGDGGRLVGGGEGSGVTTFTQLTDTPASLGTAGQKAVVNAGATALEFEDALQFNLSGSGYSNGRVLQANGNEYVDILSPALPEPSSTGVMFAWDDTTDTVVQVAAGTEGHTLRVSDTGLPELVDLVYAPDDYVDNAGDTAVDWDFQTAISNDIASGVYFTYVSTNVDSATLAHYPETATNAYYIIEIYRNPQGFAGLIFGGFPLAAGRFYLVRATRLGPASNHLETYQMNILDGVDHGWRKFSTATA